MIAKSFLLLLVIYTSDINGLDYTYNHLAGGWLKMHRAASWTDASIMCDFEGAVLASPETSQIRDAIKEYVTRLGHSGATLMTGVQADFTTGDYYTINGVQLEKMPVFIEAGSTDTSRSSESCVKWMTSSATVKVVSCSDELKFVCFKKRKTVRVNGCGNSEYIYDERSGSCYKFHPKGLTWPKAYLQCKKEGAYLAVSNNKLENVVLKDLFAQYPRRVMSSYDFDRAFVGIRDWLDGESWKTVKGQSLSDAGFTGWSSGEPNNAGGNEHCLALYRDGTYNDDQCTLSLVYICEKDPELLYQ